MISQRSLVACDMSILKTFSVSSITQSGSCTWCCHASGYRKRRLVEGGDLTPASSSHLTLPPQPTNRIVPTSTGMRASSLLHYSRDPCDSSDLLASSPSTRLSFVDVPDQATQQTLRILVTEQVQQYEVRQARPGWQLCSQHTG